MAAISYSLRYRAGFTISSKKVRSLFPTVFLSKAVKAKDASGRPSCLSGFFDGLKKSILQSD